MDHQTIAGWAAVALILWFMIVRPTAAAHIVHNISAFLSSAAHGFSTFFSSI